MRVTDGRGVEYDVSYDAERGLYVYVKVFKPSEPALSTCEPLATAVQPQSESSAS